MSSEKTSLFKVVKKQTAFKLKAHYSFFTVLLCIQLIGLFFSFNVIEMYGSSVNHVSVSVSYFSADGVIIFTMLWAFISAILITTRLYRYNDFTFVTNRLSSNLSNILFLLIVSSIAGLTAFFSRYLIRVVKLYTSNIFAFEPFVEPTSDIFVGVIATILYVLLFSALGYFSGMLVQVHKLFIVLLPVLCIGLLIIGERISNNEVNAVFAFIGLETSFFTFVVKIIALVLILFGSVTVVSNRLEVR